MSDQATNEELILGMNEAIDKIASAKWYLENGSETKASLWSYSALVEIEAVSDALRKRLDDA